MKENGRKEEVAAKFPPLSILYCQIEVKSVQTEADICSESREITKETKIGSYYKG